MGQSETGQVGAPVYVLCQVPQGSLVSSEPRRPWLGPGSDLREAYRWGIPGPEHSRDSRQSLWVGTWPLVGG